MQVGDLVKRKHGNELLLVLAMDDIWARVCYFKDTAARRHILIRSLEVISASR